MATAGTAAAAAEEAHSTRSEGSSSSTAREEVGTNDHQAARASNGVGSNVSGAVGSLAPSRHTSQTGSTTRSEDQRPMLTMPRTINTVPVWARHHDQASPTHPPHRSPSLGPSTWPRDAKHKSGGGDATRKPPALHLNDSTQARTALATKNNDARRADENDSRSISTSSVTTYGDQDAGPGRFWSFTLPRMYTRPSVPREKMEEKGGARDSGNVEEGDQARGPFKGGFSSAIAGVLSGLGGGEGQGSFDESDVARQRAHTASHDEEKQMSGAHEGARGGWSHDDTNDEGLSPALAQRERRMQFDASYTRNQPLTPGWESPWRPESRGEHSIKFGKYRFNHHGEGGYFPHTETGRSSSVRKKRRRGGKGGGNIVSDPGLLLDMGWWRHFLLHNAFVPLLFRIINVAFTTCTLAIAIKLYRTLKDEGAEDSVGSSPIVAIIFSPLTLVHVGVQIYLEYFSHPIGLWRVGSKLFYTMTEVIFICLWSAELSLSFDNYFTSTLVCTPFNSPYANDSNPVFGEQRLNDPAKKPYICRMQGALIGLVFTSLLAYVIVFSVSLFRIFVRVSKR